MIYRSIFCLFKFCYSVESLYYFQLCITLKLFIQISLKLGIDRVLMVYCLRKEKFMSNYLHYELISWRKYCLRMKLVHAFKGCRNVLMVRSTQGFTV